jgi:hypothetical protein
MQKIDQAEHGQRHTDKKARKLNLRPTRAPNPLLEFGNGKVFTQKTALVVVSGLTGWKNRTAIQTPHQRGFGITATC